MIEDHRISKFYQTETEEKAKQQREPEGPEVVLPRFCSYGHPRNHVGAGGEGEKAASQRCVIADSVVLRARAGPGGGGSGANLDSSGGESSRAEERE